MAMKLKQNLTEDQTKAVTLTGGISTVNSSLSTGEPYYVKITGGIGLGYGLYSSSPTLNTSIKKIGTAISDTKIIIQLT